MRDLERGLVAGHSDDRDVETLDQARIIGGGGIRVRALEVVCSDEDVPHEALRCLDTTQCGAIEVTDDGARIRRGLHGIGHPEHRDDCRSARHQSGDDTVVDRRRGEAASSIVDEHEVRLRNGGQCCGDGHHTILAALDDCDGDWSRVRGLGGGLRDSSRLLDPRGRGGDDDRIDHSRTDSTLDCVSKQWSPDQRNERLGHTGAQPSAGPGRRDDQRGRHHVIPHAGRARAPLPARARRRRRRSPPP